MYKKQELMRRSCSGGYATLVRDGNKVLYSAKETDDGKEYEYTGRFWVEDYEKALQRLRREGETKMIGMGNSLSLRMVNSKWVEVRYFGIAAPPRTETGELKAGAIKCYHKLEDLLLK